MSDLKKCKYCKKILKNNQIYCNQECYFKFRSQNQHSYDNLYRRYIDMKARCYNKNNCNYKYYGERGIGVCDEWLGENGYKNFKKWSLENGYKKELSLDKIDNNKNYSPNNCRWVTKRIQNINKRSNNNLIGVKLHTNKKIYYGTIKIDNKDYYTGCSKDKIEVAIMRNNYILDHKLENKLNDLSKYIGKYNMELRYEPQR